MIYGFVGQSGGHVRLESEIGSGTTFTILLPRAQSVPISREAFRHAPLRSPPGDILILVVEDDAAVLQLNVARLTRLGYQVAEANNGAQALAMLKGGLRPALVFSDATMPGGISGRDLLEQALTILPWVKVLLTSGYSEDPLTPPAPPPLAFKLLRKPHRIAELADAVLEALG
jgi:CheY-like chemotaxis protein